MVYVCKTCSFNLQVELVILPAGEAWFYLPLLQWQMSALPKSRGCQETHGCKGSLQIAVWGWWRWWRCWPRGFLWLQQQVFIKLNSILLSLFVQGQCFFLFLWAAWKDFLKKRVLIWETSRWPSLGSYLGDGHIEYRFHLKLALNCTMDGLAVLYNLYLNSILVLDVFCKF